MTSDQRIDSRDFWRDFMASRWERSPAHFTAAAIAPVITGESGFAALSSATQLLAAGARVPFRAIDMDGKPQPLDRRWLPGPGDGSLRHYAERLQALGREHRFFVQLPQLHRYDAGLWQHVRELARSVYQYIGMPAAKAWSDIYIGRYDATPFGIHLDNASNFTFGLYGKKTLYLWEPEYYERHIQGQDLHDPQPFVRDAIELTVQPGEVIYWPSRYWHVAAANGEFSITANVSFYLQDSMADRIGQAVAQLVRARLGAAEVASGFEFDPAHPQESADRLPTALQRALREVELIVGEGILAHHLGIDWLARVTRCGFEGAPIPGEAPPLDRESWVRGRPDHPILWRQPAAESLLVSANGQLMTVPSHPGMLRVIELLNDGRRRQVAALIAAAAQAPGPAPLGADRVLELVRQLARWGAVAAC